MPNYSTQLKRDGHLLNRPKATPKKPRPLPKQSAKRQREAKVYAVRRKAFLREHPFCQAWGPICDYCRAAGKSYMVKRDPFYPYPPPSEEIHHMKKPKQTYYLDESTWLACSRWSHNWIHQNPSTARKLGLLM